MQEVVIAGYLRTAQSRSRPKDPNRDWLHKIRADELLAGLFPELLKRTGIDAEEIDDFLVGSAMGVNEQWTWGGEVSHLPGQLTGDDPRKIRGPAVRVRHGDPPYRLYGDRHRECRYRLGRRYGTFDPRAHRWGAC